ncbi:S1C family serine protease [Blautia sp.]|uniref:S1C family serine protease n=1 Tax=Blautia sp. TaxID=1955243 RepID=UPI003A85E998
MSEEKRWDEDLPEVNENVPTEEKPLDTFGNTDTGSAADNSTENIDIAQKPMAHPYSAGRRMQENGYGNGTNSSNFQNNTSFQEKPKYAHYEVHQPQAGNYAGGSIPPKKPHKPKTAHGGGNGGFGKKAATAVALAVIFGLVAGAVFQGVNIAADKYRDNNSSSTQIGKTETVTGTEESTDGSSTESSVKSIVAESGTVAGVAQATMSSIVAITSVSVQEIPSFFGYGTRQYQSAGSGSGIIVGENDSELLIATNNHVVSGATTLTVCFAGGDVVGAEEETQAMASGDSITDSSDSSVDVNNAVSAKIKGTDEENDLAVIAVEKSDIPEETMNEIKIAQMGSSDDLVVGEQVVAIGNALGYGQSVTSGWVSALNRTISTEDGDTSGLIQTDAAINPGNSGGALLNMKGEVIGINAAKYADSQVEGMGYAIPISKAEPILEELMNRETRDKIEDTSKVGYMGIKAADLTTEAIQMYNMPAGAFLTEVTPGGAADKAGIKKGDIVVKLDGQKVSGKNDLVDKLQYYESGETVEVVIARANNGEYKEETVEVTLGSKPASDN